MRLLILFLLISCSPKIGNNGVTDEIGSRMFSTRESALNHVDSLLKILCLKNGYTKMKILNRRLTRYSGNFQYRAWGIAQCLSKKEKK